MSLINTLNTPFKKTALAVAIAGCLTAQPALAERSEGQQTALSAGIFTTLTIAGIALAGPAGMLVGSLGGYYLAEETREANESEILQKEAQETIASLEQNISQHETAIAQLEQSTLDKLLFQVMFPTGEDALNEHDIDRIKILADYLDNNPSLVINLDGHADPRGTDEYNNVLAEERAKSVKQSLVFFGIQEERITTHGHGSSFSTAGNGNIAAYAQDRRVEIEILSKDTQAPVAQN